jgi:hypothetical protein
MTFRSLTRRQLATLDRINTRNLRFYARLLKRMDQLGWDVNDPERLAVAQAHDGAHSLRVHLHYASCESGVGQRRKDDSGH